MDSVKIVEADLNCKNHQQAVVDLIDAYAMDPMGNAGALPKDIKKALIPGLKEHPTTLIFLAMVNRLPVGIAVCFIGFSTFAARPLVNIHDLAVLPTHRSNGIGRLLLAGVERKALEMGCCKVTLEVLENNHPAIKMYAASGFSQATYPNEAGGALFFAKMI